MQLREDFSIFSSECYHYNIVVQNHTQSFVYLYNTAISVYICGYYNNFFCGGKIIWLFKSFSEIIPKQTYWNIILS